MITHRETHHKGGYFPLTFSLPIFFNRKLIPLLHSTIPTRFLCQKPHFEAVKTSLH